jgi:hypothetical protein
MSLEAAIAENTAALHEVAVLLKAGNAGRTEAIKAASALQENKVTGRPPGSKNKKAELTTTVVPVTEATAATTETPKPAATPTSDKITQAQDEALRNLIGNWLSKDDDMEARKQRAAPIRTIFEKYGIKKAPEVSPSEYANLFAEIEAAITEASASSEEESLL